MCKINQNLQPIAVFMRTCPQTEVKRSASLGVTCI